MLLLVKRRDLLNIHLAVADDGQGIPVGKRVDIFEPFQRIDTGSQSGYGLGLAIVSRIARAHDASVEVNTDASLGGAVFKVVIPQAG